MGSTHHESLAGGLLGTVRRCQLSMLGASTHFRSWGCWWCWFGSALTRAEVPRVEEQVPARAARPPAADTGTPIFASAWCARLHPQLRATAPRSFRPTTP